MTTTAPGLADVHREAPAGPGIHPPGPSAEGTAPGERATPAPAAAAPVTAGESRVGLPASPAGDSLHDPERPRPKPMPLPPRSYYDREQAADWPGTQQVADLIPANLPPRTRQPRAERTCPCLMCKPFVSG